MPDINDDLPVVFPVGSRIALVDSATEYFLRFLEPGTVREVPGREVLHEFTERGVPQNPLVGDGQYSEIQIQAMVTLDGTTVANDLMALLEQSPASGAPARASGNASLRLSRTSPAVSAVGNSSPS